MFGTVVIFGKAKVEVGLVPFQTGSLTYNGAAQSPVLGGFNESAMELGGVTSATDAGTYDAIVSLKEGYVWSDGTIDPKTVSWSIAPLSIAAPSADNTSFVYSGAAQGPVFSYDTTHVTIGGDSAAKTNAGSYSASFTLKNTTNTKWWDNSTGPKSIAWSIARASTAVPTVSGSKTYNGTEQTVSLSGYDSAKMTLGGTYKATNAGSYSASVTPTANYCWPDGSTGAKPLSWSISKAAGSLTLSTASLALTADTPTGTITVTRPGDGAISAVSSNTGVATVSVSGNTVTVTGKANGSATITVTVGAGTNYTAPANKTCSVAVSFAKIYGASWDGTSTTKWTRTDDAASFVDPVPYVAGATTYGSPFDNLLPWSGMVRSERTGGTMVAIPKFWYKITQNGVGMKIQIADHATAGYAVSPAHMNRGDGKGERDVVYVGRYHCGSTNYKSVTGQAPKNNITRATARTEIHKLGTNIWQADFAMRFTIWLLYIVEFADWNSQATIGYGCGNNRDTQGMGYTDSMPYHTGITLIAHNAWGLGTQYRNIEGLWDNVFDWCDGCRNSTEGFMIFILNPNNFSDSSGGTSVGTPSTGYPSAFAVKTNGDFPVFIPTAAIGSATTYTCDFWAFNTSYVYVYVGGNYNWDENYGLFFVNYSGVETGRSIGCRLQELP